jgi:hypothetical protein
MKMAAKAHTAPYSSTIESHPPRYIPKRCSLSGPRAPQAGRTRNIEQVHKGAPLRPILSLENGFQNNPAPALQACFLQRLD